MPPLGVRDRQQPEKVGQFIILPGLKHQVPVGGHEAIGQDADGQALVGLFQHPDERGIIRLLAERGLAGRPRG